MAEFLVVTGMSGAGRSTAAASLEDHGWFVIDNLPPAIIPSLIALVGAPGAEEQRVALVTGRTGGRDANEVLEAVKQLEESEHTVQVLFLDAPDEVLVRRFEGTRRRHPWRDIGVKGAVSAERTAFGGLMSRADVVLDTGELNVNQLRSRIAELFADTLDNEAMQTTIMSFGFKHGLPMDVDMVFDVRFLPNPYWEDSLREGRGLDVPVRDYVLGQADAQAFIDRSVDLVASLIPSFVREGKAYLTVGIGCTGGHHRSVAIAEEIARRLRLDGFLLSVFHRDLER